MLCFIKAWWFFIPFEDAVSIGKDDRQEIIAPRIVGVAPGRVRLHALAMRRFPVNIRQESRPLVTACPAQRSCRRPDSNPLIHVP